LLLALLFALMVSSSERYIAPYFRHDATSGQPLCFFAACFFTKLATKRRTDCSASWSSWKQTFSVSTFTYDVRSPRWRRAARRRPFRPKSLHKINKLCRLDLLQQPNQIRALKTWGETVNFFSKSKSLLKIDAYRHHRFTRPAPRASSHDTLFLPAYKFQIVQWN